MISASARICKLLGKDFAHYLPLVMPAVIKAAEFKPEVAVVDGESRLELESHITQKCRNETSRVLD